MIREFIAYIQPRGAAYTAIYSAFVITIYFSTLDFLFYQLRIWEDYNYGYIIPLVVLYLIWEKRDLLSATPGILSYAGLAFAAAGLGLFWIGELGGELFMQYISLWMVISGLVWMHLGWKKLQIILFPIAFLLTMFPLPHFITASLTLNLKLISSKLGVMALQALGHTAYREGNIIDLGFTQLQVVDACSGLRYLIPLIVLGILVAYFYRSAWWKKVLVILSAIPISIVINGMRIATVGLLYPVWGPMVAESFFHDFSGWIIFIISLGFLLGEMWVLKKIFPEKEFSSEKSLEFKVEGKPRFNVEDAKPKAETGGNALAKAGESKAEVNPPQVTQPIADDSPHKPETINLKPVPFSLRTLFQPPQFVVAVVLLAATLAAAHGIEFREKVAPAKSFAEFPMQLGEWVGRRDVMEQKFIEALHLDDYVTVDYANGSKAVNFYTAYYQSQRKGESIHSPETCLPAGGWEFKNVGSVALPLKASNGALMRVNKAFMIKGNAKQLSYFWFPQRDRVLTNAWELKWFNFWDALMRQRTDGALVRLITPVYPNEDVPQAEARLTAFTREIVPVLNEFLPK
jgi:EpsI family protein